MLFEYYITSVTVLGEGVRNFGIQHIAVKIERQTAKIAMNNNSRVGSRTIAPYLTDKLMFSSDMCTTSVHAHKCHRCFVKWDQE